MSHVQSLWVSHKSRDAATLFCQFDYFLMQRADKQEIDTSAALRTFLLRKFSVLETLLFLNIASSFCGYSLQSEKTLVIFPRIQSQENYCMILFEKRQNLASQNLYFVYAE